ncbi:hypothetical protein UCDDA912_g00094 [Diaporthe ampelina]|uniref:Uncharacterized protein n=1 Tax=Diaporthe ampelina TaxID=1214573 RepID=A0A0G2G0T1_9PEZI|nr:hypothetical protein UCDDA912_g00094 [Diaporthe ampelina]
MTEEFRRFWEALRRHRRVRPALYRAPSWWNEDFALSTIDEFIEVANENDRYGEPLVFEEADADGRWMLHVAELHERRWAIAKRKSEDRVWNSGSQTAASQKQPLSKNLALGSPHDAADDADDADADGDETLGSVLGQSRDTMQPDFPFSSPESGAHLSGPLARSKSSTHIRTPISRDTPQGHSDSADRNKENNRIPRSLFDKNGLGAFESDSSDDEDMDADDAEREQIFQLFEDFPTCIRKARHIPAIDNDNHGIMVISNPESGWSHIDPARLPPRVQKYLAEFTVLDAAAFPDGVYPDLALNGGNSHRWLLATARKEFVCDTWTLDVWYKSLTHMHQTKNPRRPL